MIRHRGEYTHVEGRASDLNPRTRCGRSARLNRTVTRYEFSWNGKLNKCPNCLTNLALERKRGERRGLGSGRPVYVYSLSTVANEVRALRAETLAASLVHARLVQHGYPGLRLSMVIEAQRLVRGDVRGASGSGIKSE